MSIMKKGFSKLTLLKEVIKQIPPQQQNLIKGGNMNCQVPTAKGGTTRTVR